MITILHQTCAQCGGWFPLESAVPDELEKCKCDIPTLMKYEVNGKSGKVMATPEVLDKMKNISSK